MPELGDYHALPQESEGRALVRTASGRIVRSSAEIALQEEVTMTFAHGSAAARVTSKEETQ